MTPEIGLHKRASSDYARWVRADLKLAMDAMRAGNWAEAARYSESAAAWALSIKHAARRIMKQVRKLRKDQRRGKSR